MQAAPAYLTFSGTKTSAIKQPAAANMWSVYLDECASLTKCRARYWIFTNGSIIDLAAPPYMLTQ